MSTVSILFACRSSVYGSMAGVDVFDLARDARSFDLSGPVVAHPPCRAWGGLSHMAKPRADERDLAIFAMWAVRHCGGVLEHPIRSKLWQFFGLVPGVRDPFGGLLVPVDQVSYGHRAQKRSGLYIVGAEFTPRIGGVSSVTVERMCRQERERTPPEFAQELVDLARASRV